MIDDRRSHQCHRDGCDTEAKFAVRLRVNCVAPGVVQPVAMDCSIKVCERHREEVRLFVLSDRNRETIRTSLMEGGYHEPDFMTARLEFVPVAAPVEKQEERTVLHVRGPTVCCDRAGCANPAKWQIKQRFRMMWQRGKGRPMVEALTNMCVCDKHRNETKAADFLDADSRSATLGWLSKHGVSLPDFDTSEIAFIPMTDGGRVSPKVFVGKNAIRESADGL